MGQVVFQANNTSGCTPLGVVLSVTSPAAASITSYSWQITTPSGGVLSSNSAQYIGIFSIPGDYDVSLTINGNQTQTISDYVSVHALPVANFTVNDAAGCFPLCVNFSDVSVVGEGNIVEWSWDFGDGGSSNQQNPSYCYTQPGTFTPVFSIEDEFGCYDDFVIPGLIQVVNNFPNASFTPSSQLDCNPPVDITMTNNSSGTSALTSLWDYGDGNTETVSGTSAITHTFTNVGSYNVCLTVSDQIGCVDQACTLVNIFGTANAQFTVSSTSGCEGDVFTFVNTTTPIPTIVEWDFNGDGIVDSNNPTASYSYLNSGSYQPSLHVEYSGGCFDTESAAYTITVLDGVDVDFEADALSSCSFPFTVNFNNLSTSPGTIQYEWFIDGVSVGNSVDLSHTFNGYGAYDIRLVATNSAGCTNELILTDYILVQEPIVDFDNGVSVCTDQNVPIFNVMVTSVDPVAFYFWDFNSDGTTDAQGLAPMYMYDAPGIFNITLTIETVTGCTASYTNSQVINVLTMVVADFTTSADTTCAGEPVEFCVLNQPGNTYSWNFFDGSGWVIMPLNESCLIHDYTDTGWYDISLTVFNGACNVLQTFENFIYVEPPVALFEYQVLCGGVSAEFVDTSIGADSIVWDFGDGSALLSNDPNPTHDFPSNGTYTVTIAAYADGSDCPDFQSAQITVSAPDPSMYFTPNSGCPPLDAQFYSVEFYPHWDVTVSNGDHITVDWSDVTDHWTVTHTFSGGSESFSYSNPNYFYWPEVTFTEGGFYDVTAIVTDENGCSVTQLFDDAIHVSANPDFASFSTSVVDVCNSVNIDFTPDLPDLVSWQWIFSDGSVVGSENPNHVFQPPYNYSAPLNATLTATDSLGCVSTVSQNIDLVLPPVVSFVAASDPSCIGDLVQFINFSTGPAGTTYTWDFGDPTSTSNTSTSSAPAHSFDSNGTFEVCLTADNNAGCQVINCNTNAVHIVNPVVSFDFTSSINNCLYGVQFQNTTPGTVITSAWDFGDAQSGFGMMAYHTYPIGVYDATLTVANNYGCVDSLVVPDILNYGNQVGPYTQVLDSADCAPFNVSFAAFNPNDTYFDYFWDFNNGSGDPSGNTSTTYTYLEPGTYCPSIIMTDPNGCPVLISCQDSIVVTEFVMSYTVPDYICFGDTIGVTVGNATTYSWSDMTSISTGQLPNEFVLHPNDDTDFILTGTYADCTRIDTIHLVVRDLPVVSLTMDNSVCYGDSIIPLDAGSPSDPPGQYFVNGQPEISFNPSWPAENNYDIEYQYTDTFQCFNSTHSQVYIHALPTVVFPDLMPVCEDGGMIVLSGATPPGGTFLYQSDTINSFLPQTGYGDYLFTYTYTDTFGCVNMDEAGLRVNPLPVPSMTFQDECLDDDFDIQNNSSIPEGSITQTLWDFGVAGSDSNYNPTPVYFPYIGSYPVSMSLQSDAGCFAELDSVVVIHAIPHVQFSPSTACQYTPQIFQEQSTIEADTMVTWLWLTEGQAYSSPDSLAYVFQNWGDIDVTLVVTSDFGCDDSLTTSIVVHPSPSAVLTIVDGCLGTESVFHSDATIPIGGVVHEEWEFGDTHQNEIGSDVDNLYDAVGTYQITYTALSNLGCENVMTDSITIFPKPEVDFMVDPHSICAGVPFALFDLSSVDAPSNVVAWNWSMEGAVLGAAQNLSLTWPQAGSYDITLEVTTDHGCSSDSTSEHAITVYPNPEAGFSVTEQTTAYDPIVEINNEAGQDVTSWYYDLGDGDSETYSSGEHVYSEPGYYQVIQYVWNTFGCRDTVSHMVEVTPEVLIYIPNAFTPDQNGHNEYFIPVISGFDVTYYDFKIFNRWGIEIFSTTDRAKGWDGTIGDIIAEDGSYSWKLEIRSGTDVTIMRRFGNVILLR